MAGLPAPSATLDVSTHFGTVRVYRFGPADGVPLLLLPGRTAAAPMWEANLAGLAKSRPVYATDLIGEPGLSVQTRQLDLLQRPGGLARVADRRPARTGASRR